MGGLPSLLEGTKLNCYCNVSEIRKFINSLEQSGRLADINADEYLEYLKQRYYVGGELTSYFQYLYIERSGSPPEVLDALCNASVTQKNKVVGCLVIIFRLRNNLFHGEKWAYNLEGQKTNFIHANKFMCHIMDCV